VTDADYDVAIVGASIAGCTAATFFGRQGARVALLESHSDPSSYKVMCTHVFQASGHPVVRRLGILEDLEAAGAQEAEVNMWSRFGWVSPSSRYRDGVEKGAVGLNIRRQTLDPIMRRMASETDGVELTMGHTATSLLREGGRVGGVRVRDRDGKERELPAALVVGADGRNSEVARLAGERTKIKPNNRFVYMAYYRDTPLVTGSSPIIWFLDPDMAYAFPTDGGLTMLACVPHKDRIPEFKADPEAAMARMFERAPEMPRLDPSKRVSKMLGKLDAPNEKRRPAGDGYALIGDAAMASDPLWGVGIGWALQSAEWLAEEAGPALRDERALDRALKRYALHHRKALNGHDRICSAYSSGRRFLPGEKLFFRAAARDDELAGRVALFGERWIKPSQLMTPSTIWLAIKANLSREARPLGLREAAREPLGPELGAAK
jgi:2-polyprenyl-6-methoxyphenol hydroxylase-like FAD-dependent oxidoreductase